jgi:hypothetical protein
MGGRRSGTLPRPLRLALAVLSIGLPLCLAAESRATDFPRIVPWSTIGQIRLNMPLEEVERHYGERPLNSLGITNYNVGGRILRVRYWRAKSNGFRVFSVSTRSAYYRTPVGVGVGTVIPLGRCHRTQFSPCQRRWHAFVYVANAQAWLAGTRVEGLRTTAYLAMRRGRVASVTLQIKAED